MKWIISSPFKKCLDLQCKQAEDQCVFMCLTVCANVASLPPLCNPQIKWAALIPIPLVHSSLGFALRHMNKLKANGLSSSPSSLFVSHLEVTWFTWPGDVAPASPVWSSKACGQYAKSVNDLNHDKLLCILMLYHCMKSPFSLDCQYVWTVDMGASKPDAICLVSM